MSSLLDRAKQDKKAREKQKRAEARDRRNREEALFAEWTEQAAKTASRKLDTEISSDRLTNRELAAPGLEWDLVVDGLRFIVKRRHSTGYLALYLIVDPDGDEPRQIPIRRLADVAEALA